MSFWYHKILEKCKNCHLTNITTSYWFEAVIEFNSDPGGEFETAFGEEFDADLRGEHKYGFGGISKADMLPSSISIDGLREGSICMHHKPTIIIFLAILYFSTVISAAKSSSIHL